MLAVTRPLNTHQKSARIRGTRTWRIFVGACLLLLPQAVAASSPSPSVQTLLTKYLRSTTGINIRGRVLTVHPTPVDVQTTVRRVVRRADGKSLSVFESPPHEKGVIIAEDGVWTSRYTPSERAIRRKRSLDRVRNGDVERLRGLILRNYAVRIEGTESIAGRPCWRLSFRPRYGNNGMVRLWLDKATGVDLRRDELDESGSTASLMLFTSVSFPRQVSLAEVTPRYPAGVRVSTVTSSTIYQDLAELSKVAGFTVRMPLVSPSGFHFVAGAAGTLSARPAAFLRLTDGLSDITVIETPTQKRGNLTSRTVRVMPRPYGEVEVDYILDDIQVVMIGRSDPRELLASAESLDPERERQWRRQVTREFRGCESQVEALRARGLTGETVVALVALSHLVGRPAGALLQSYNTSWCWRDTARRFGVAESMVARHVQALKATP